jgi:hypothetical protein
MTKGLRTKDFKLGCLHGRLQAIDPKSEAHIQRNIFLSQRIKVWRKINLTPIIRIFGYEIPIENHKRGRCIDLMGYDENHDLFIIELKRRDSTEKIKKVIEQINNYADSVQQILPDIEKEFKEVFFFPIKFASIKKMIIAPREFYKGKEHLLTDKAIDFGYFRNKDICKREPRDLVQVCLKVKR